MRAVLRSGKVNVFHDRAPALSVWRHWISAAAVGAMAGTQPMSGPVVVVLSFYLPRPMLHRTKAGELAPRFVNAKPDHAPDLDKLARAALDAMSGIVFFDDGQVVNLLASKKYDEGQGGLMVSVAGDA